MPIAITERNAIAAQPLQRAINAQLLRVIHLQPRPGNFNQIPVAPVPRPEDCGSICMTDSVGFGIGLASSGITACAGAGGLPWTVWGLGHSLNIGVGFGLSIAGALPGLACSAGLGLWAYQHAK